MMNAVAGYFKNIKEAALTVFDGMSVSISYLFRQPITVQYPDKTAEPVIDMMPEGYRGILDVKMEKCTGCLACMRTCPVQCINIEVAKLGDPPRRMITEFGIYIAKCMFCGLCSEACPTGAIYHTKEFEGATGKFDDLVCFFVDEPVAPAKPKKEEGEEKKKPKFTPEELEALKKKAAAKKAAAAKKKAEAGDGEAPPAEASPDPGSAGAAGKKTAMESPEADEGKEE